MSEIECGELRTVGIRLGRRGGDDEREEEEEEEEERHLCVCV